MPTGTSRIFKIGAAAVVAGMSMSPSASTAHLPKQVEDESRNNTNKGVGFPCTGPIEPAPQIEIKIEYPALK